MAHLKGSLESKNMFVKVIILLATLTVCAFVFMGVYSALLLSGAVSSSSVSALRSVQMLQTLSLFVLPALLTAYLVSHKPMTWLGLSQAPGWKQSLLVIVFMIIALPGINLLGYLNQQLPLPDFMSGIEQVLKDMEESAAETIELFLNSKSVGVFVLNLIVMALLPAIGEEMFFRGSLQQIFSEKGHKSIAIWVTAIIFSAVHMQFYGFFPRMLLGALFGYLLVYSGSLWLPMIAHFTNNAMVVILYFVAIRKGIDTEVFDTLGSGSTLWLGILSLVLCCLAIAMFAVWSKRRAKTDASGA